MLNAFQVTFMYRDVLLILNDVLTIDTVQVAHINYLIIRGKMSEYELTNRTSWPLLYCRL